MKEKHGLGKVTPNPIQDGYFRGHSRIGKQKSPPSLKSVTHINDETWNSHTLPKGDLKDI